MWTEIMQEPFFVAIFSGLSVAAIVGIVRLIIVKNRAEKATLDEAFDIEKRMIRHRSGDFFTLSKKARSIKYCMTCWEEEKTMRQMRYNGSWFYRCTKCGNQHDHYDWHTKTGER